MTERTIPGVATRFSSCLPLVILALTLVIVFHRLWLGEVFFWGLPALQFYPWREYAFDVLRQGQLPLWNPYNGAGAPLIANYQSALFYPLNWPGIVLPLARSMSVTAVLHLFIAGWGMWMFTGRLGIPSLGRGMSALAFGMTGYLVARLGTYPIISAAAWLPWILWAALGVLSVGKRRDAAWLALFAALQLLAGHGQTTWYSMLLVAAFSVWWILSHRTVRPWRNVALLIVALVIGVGIATIQLLPTGELLLLSQRSDGVDYEFAMNFSYRPATTLNFLSPNVFGNPADGSYILKDKGAFFEDAVYIGLIPLISAFAAIVSWLWSKLRKVERPVYFASVPLWLLVVFIAYIFALGENSPVFPFLYNNVPTFDLFQAPVRWHIWTVFGLSVLAGIGVGAWGRGHWLFFGTRLAIAACVGAAVLAFLSPRFLPPDVATNDGVQVFIRAVIVTGILGALAGVLTLRQPEQPNSRWYFWWSLAVLLVIAVDLGYAALGLNPTVPASFYDRLTPANQNLLRTYWPADAEETLKYQTFLQFDDYRVAMDNWPDFRASGLANLNLLDRTYSLNNFDPLLIGHFADYIELIESYPQQRDTLLQAAGVNTIYDMNGNIVELEHTAARAWFVGSACWHPDEMSLKEAMLQPEWQALRQVHLLGNGTCLAPNLNEIPPGEILAIRGGGTLDVRVERDSWLVLADTYYTNLGIIYDDAHIAPVERANLAFQAVWIPAGTRMVQLLGNNNWWLIPGLSVSIVSLFITLVLFRTKTPVSDH